MNADNQIRVRYRLSEEEKGEEYHENYGYYEAPNLIVKAKEIPPEPISGEPVNGGAKCRY